MIRNIFRKLRIGTRMLYKDLCPVGLSNTDRGDLFSNEAERYNLLYGHLNPTEDVSINLWPGFHTAAFNLQFDDFSVKSPLHGEFDFGGEPNTGVNKHLMHLLQKFPHLKVTLFAIPDFRLIGKGIPGKRHPAGQFSIANPQHKDWLAWIHSEDFKNIEIAMHGYNHVHSDEPCFAAVEFAYKNQQQATHAIQQATALFQECAVGVSGFRPPAWGIGRNEVLIDVLREHGFSYIACSNPCAGINYKQKKVSNLFPQPYKGILNVPENCTLTQDVQTLSHIIQSIVKQGGFIGLKGHYIAGTDWIKSGLSTENVEKVEDILQLLEKEYPQQIWYATLKEVATWVNTLYHIEVTTKDGTVSIKNNNKEVIALGVTIHDKQKLISIPGNSTKEVK